MFIFEEWMIMRCRESWLTRLRKRFLLLSFRIFHDPCKTVMVYRRLLIRSRWVQRLVWDMRNYWEGEACSFWVPKFIQFDKEASFLLLLPSPHTISCQKPWHSIYKEGSIQVSICVSCQWLILQENKLLYLFKLINDETHICII